MTSRSSTVESLPHLPDSLFPDNLLVMRSEFEPIGAALQQSSDAPDMDRVLTAIGLLQEAGHLTSPANLAAVLEWPISRVRTALAAATERGYASKRDDYASTPRRGEQ